MSDNSKKCSWLKTRTRLPHRSPRSGRNAGGGAGRGAGRNAGRDAGRDGAGGLRIIPGHHHGPARQARL